MTIHVSERKGICLNAFAEMYLPTKKSEPKCLRSNEAKAMKTAVVSNSDNQKDLEGH